MFLQITDEAGSTRHELSSNSAIPGLVLGDWSVSVQKEKSLKGDARVKVLFWDNNTKPNWKGEISPVRIVSLSESHPKRTVMRGLFGLGGHAQLQLSK